jgi:hypothetical protein
LATGISSASDPPSRWRDRGNGERELPIVTLKSLKQLNRTQLEQLYAGADVGTPPVGFVRGEVLLLTEIALPRYNKAITRVIWRGKHFNEQGDFINQWTGFRAVESRGYIDNSFFDGRPSLILEYRDEIPFFGNMRDEAREVGPDLYLSFVYERTPPFKMRGIIGLELNQTKGKKAFVKN